MNAKLTAAMAAFTMVLGISPLQSATRICADPYTGDILARTRCKNWEVTLNTNNIWGVLRGKNNYVAACRSVEKSDTASPTTAGVSIECNPDEFLLNYGDYTRPVALNVVRQNEITYSGSIPVGVAVIAQNDFGVPSYSNTTGWTFHVTATCCPRL